jgi:hypothetical protein
MRKTLERSGSLWVPSRRELLSALGVGLLAPRVASAATFTLLTHAQGYWNTPIAYDSTGADLLVAVVVGYGSSVGVQTPDNKGNNWITALAVDDNSTPNHLRIQYVSNPVTGAGHSLSYLGGSSSYSGAAVACYSGSKLSSPLDPSINSAIGSGTSIAPGAVTPTMSNELVISAMGARNPGAAPTVSGGGMSIIDAMGNHGTYSWAMGMAYAIQTAAAAVNPTWSLSSSGCVAATVAFKSSSSALGGTSVRHRVISDGQ